MSNQSQKQLQAQLTNVPSKTSLEWAGHQYYLASCLLQYIPVRRWLFFWESLVLGGKATLIMEWTFLPIVTPSSLISFRNRADVGFAGDAACYVRRWPHLTWGEAGLWIVASPHGEVRHSEFRILSPRWRQETSEGLKPLDSLPFLPSPTRSSA